MADNSLRTPGSGETIRTIDRGSYKTPVSLIDVGDGSEQLVGPQDGLPITYAFNGFDAVSVTTTPSSYNINVDGFAGFYIVLHYDVTFTDLFINVEGSLDSFSTTKNLTIFPINSYTEFDAGAGSYSSEPSNSIYVDDGANLSAVQTYWVPTGAWDAVRVNHSVGTGGVSLSVRRSHHAPDNIYRYNATPGNGWATIATTNVQYSMQSAVTAVASSDTIVTLVAPNPNRQGFVITNTDANALYIIDNNDNDVNTTTNFLKKINSGESWQCDWALRSEIQGIWAANGSGHAVVAEIVFD